MDLSIITVSTPVDQETLYEMQKLCEEITAVEGYHYAQLLNMQSSVSLGVNGFYVLAYDDDENKLVGVASAFDTMGLRTFEWSVVVLPMYRRLGIATALVSTVQQGFQQRSYEGELALVIEGAPHGRRFIERLGYDYSFSEATMKASAEKCQQQIDIQIAPYINQSRELVDIYTSAFGDLPEEAEELIAYNTTNEGHTLWVASIGERVVGTVTSVKGDGVQWVTGLAVHPHYRGQGIGLALLNWVKDYAFQNGDQFVLLDVEIENVMALRVYEKAHFLKTTQVDYFVKK